jgi:aryl-alcohol dehydrogenase-like predicted oxidoreductase
VFLAKVPRIIVGAADIGSVLPDVLVRRSDRARAFARLDALVDAGCSAFDLAASYQAGGTERFFGAWIGSRKNRDRLFLISKGGHPIPFVRPRRLTPSAIESDLHASLKRLRTDHIDLYLLHRDDEDAPVASLLQALARFQRDGKIGAWGVSNWTHARIRDVATLARATSVPSPTASSPHFSLAAWAKPPWNGCVSIAGPAQSGARKYYEDTKLPVLAWSPLGSGYFSPSRDAGHRDRVYGSASNVATRDRATSLAKHYGVSASHIALAYLLSQPFPVFAIVAASGDDRMRRNLEIASLKLTADERRWLESAGAPPRSLGGS